LFDRVVQFDRLERGGIAEQPVAASGDIADQLARLRAAFGQLKA
jgi:regulator of CtrA degradation